MMDGEEGEEERRSIFNLFLLLPERCKIIPMLKGNELLENLRKLGDLFGLLLCQFFNVWSVNLWCFLRWHQKIFKVKPF